MFFRNLIVKLILIFCSANVKALLQSRLTPEEVPLMLDESPVVINFEEDCPKTAGYYLFVSTDTNRLIPQLLHVTKKKYRLTGNDVHEITAIDSNVLCIWRRGKPIDVRELRGFFSRPLFFPLRDIAQSQLSQDNH